MADDGSDSHPLSSRDPNGMDNRSIWTFFVLVGIAFGIMGWFGASLTFGGSWYFLKLIEWHQLVHPFQRIATAPLQYPTLLVASHTNSLPLLRHVFGLSYALAPVGALVASWLVVRRRASYLMVWPILGIGLVALPGLLYPASEGVIAAEWAWPLILVTLVSLDGLTLISGIGFAGILFFLHPTSILVFAVVALISVIRAVRRTNNRPRCIVWAGVMIVSAALRFTVMHSDLADPNHAVTVGKLLKEFNRSEFGLPFLSYVLTIAAGVLLLRLRHTPSLPQNRWARLTPTVLIAVAGVCLIAYVSRASLWASAANVRDLVLLLELPLIAIAVFDEFASIPVVAQQGDSGVPARGSAGIAVGVVLCVTLGLWSISWMNQTHWVAERVSSSRSYCVNPKTVAKPGTDLHILYTEELAIDLESRTPSHVVMAANDCRTLRETGVLHLFEYVTPVRGGWFHFSTLG
jgi:hypothetical protein